jgi:hypothetical protein
VAADGAPGANTEMGPWMGPWNTKQQPATRMKSSYPGDWLVMIDHM